MRARISALMAVLVLMSAPFAGSGIPGAQAGPATETQVQCRRTHDDGRGFVPGHLKFCVHPNATLGVFEASVGRHLQADFFALCSNGGARVHGSAYGYSFDHRGGFGSVGLKPPSFPNADTVVHLTADGRFRIRHRFRPDFVTTSAIVEVTITNVSTQPIKAVRYSRAVDVNVMGEFANRWLRDTDVVAALDGLDIGLRAATPSVAHLTEIEPVAASVETCTSTGAVPGPVDGNYMGRLTYRLGTIAPGRSVTVRLHLEQLQK